MKYYTVTEASNLFGVSVKTLQRWDREGIFVPLRTVTNRRIYTQEQIDNALQNKEKYVDKKDILYGVTEAYQRLTINKEKIMKDNNLILPTVNRENTTVHVIFVGFFRPYENIIFDSYDFDYNNMYQTIVVSHNSQKNNILCMVVGDNDCNKENGINYLQKFMKNNNCQSGIFVYDYRWVLMVEKNIIKEIDFSKKVDMSDFKPFLYWV